MQISLNCNYGAAGAALGENLQQLPALDARRAGHATAATRKPSPTA
jgi:hypothetical protein